ncbi:MAG: hypothetical protein ABSB91_01715 [Sedimentisphaerales bacterium]
MVDRLRREEIELPKNLDVLVHLPMSRVPSEENVCVAHALQYSISAVGSNPEESLEKLVNLVTRHCIEAQSMGINPLNVADYYYWEAFAVGSSMTEAFSNVHARVSMQLARCLGYPDVRVRSICALQEKMGKLDIKELVENH